MMPRTIEGWELEIIQKDLLYRHVKTIGQKELKIDINVERPPKDLWGSIEDLQNLENRIDITYDQWDQRWKSTVHDMQSKFSSVQRPGPRINQDFDTSADLAEFLVKLADEIARTSWETVKNLPELEFTANSETIH